ncbi:hypothetical protein HN51_004092 [Arachis hypogaea]
METNFSSVTQGKKKIRKKKQQSVVMAGCSSRFRYFYLLTNDKDKPWFQGLSKAKKAEVKRETKENIKKSRREWLDPENPPATTLDMLKQNLGKEKANESSIEKDGEAKPIALEGDNQSVTYEELRQRLHRKLEDFCSSHENLGRAKKREDRNTKRGFEDRKRKKGSENEENKVSKKESTEKMKKDVAETLNELVFGHIKLKDGWYLSFIES